MTTWEKNEDLYHLIYPKFTAKLGAISFNDFKRSVKLKLESKMNEYGCVWIEKINKTNGNPKESAWRTGSFDWVGFGDLSKMYLFKPEKMIKIYNDYIQSNPSKEKRTDSSIGVAIPVYILEKEKDEIL